eukprot:9445336-Lingulodinium_polyedra.AAC.1
MTQTMPQTPRARARARARAEPARANARRVAQKQLAARGANPITRRRPRNQNVLMRRRTQQHALRWRAQTANAMGARGASWQRA